MTENKPVQIKDLLNKAPITGESQGIPTSTLTPEQPVQPQQPTQPQTDIWRKLKAKSPDKPISSYKEHPLNFLRSESFGQIIRGLEGFLDDLNLAIVDIIVGSLRFLYENFGKSKKQSQSKETNEVEPVNKPVEPSSNVDEEFRNVYTYVEPE